MKYLRVKIKVVAAETTAAVAIQEPKLPLEQAQSGRMFDKLRMR